MKIRELRIRAGLTQQAVSEGLGYRHQSTVAMIESGERKLPVDKIPLLANILGCEIAELFEDETKAG